MGLVQHSSKTNQHFTPEPIVEAARALMGGIDLDPASCQLAQQVVRAGEWYGLDHPNTPCRDGLLAPWKGRVFLNPPGGRASFIPASLPKTRSNAALWWAMLARSWEGSAYQGQVTEAIFIGFTLEIMRSAQHLEETLSPLDFVFCVPRSRIAFDTLGEDDKRVSSSSPAHANVIVYLPPRYGLGVKHHHERFVDHFSKFGTCRL